MTNPGPVKNRPHIVLVRPQMAENIGACIRAMANFKLHSLRLVQPRDGWPQQAGIDMASGGLDYIDPVTIFDGLGDALAGCHYVYGTTARRRDMVKPAFNLFDAVQDARARTSQGQQVAFVFGPERTGLENRDLNHCHATVHIDTAPEFPSINLAQAVLLAAYEWRCGIRESAGVQIDYGDSTPAAHEDLDAFLERLETLLHERHFFRSAEMQPAMIRNIRNIFLRGDVSDQELRTLHGILSALIGNKKKPHA